MSNEKTDLELFFEQVKSNKKDLESLIQMAFRVQNYVFAKEVKDYVRENFPKTEEQHKAESEAYDMNLAFRMADLNVPLPESWLIKQVVKAHMKRKGKLSIDETSTLVAKMHQLFD